MDLDLVLGVGVEGAGGFIEDHDLGVLEKRAATERLIHWQPTGPNPLHHRDDFSRPARRHGSLISLLQVAKYPPS
jgi:hypothetical protein